MWFLDVALFAGGYAASIYSWSYLKSYFVSAETEVSSLIAKVEALVPGSKVTVTPVAPPVAPVATKSS